MKPKSKKEDPDEDKEQGRVTGVDQNTSALELEAGDQTIVKNTSQSSGTSAIQTTTNRLVDLR